MTDAREPFEDAVEDPARGLPSRIGEKADSAGVTFANRHRRIPFIECGVSACCCDLAGVGEERNAG